MGDLWDGARQALALLLGGDAETWGIIGRSLAVSGLAVFSSALLGIPLGALLGLVALPGRRLLLLLISTGTALPPVVVGVVVYLLLSQAGPLGGLGWLFTPRAMVLAQTILSLPLIALLTYTAVRSIDPALRLQLRALGASDGQVVRTLVWEARAGVIVAVLVGFGRCLAEVGAVLLVGGNIRGATRVLTTAIVLETRNGAFDHALALAIVLLLIACIVNTLALVLQGRIVAEGAP